MDEKKLEAKKHFAGEKRPSMKRRDDCHDYQERRMYMITIEVTGRQPLLGTLRGTASALPGSTDAPRLEPSELGRAVEREWWGISRYYPQIEVKALQLMPDHLHGILFVRERLPVHLGHVIRGFKTGCNKKLRELQAAGSVAAQPLPAEKGRREAAGSVAAQPLPAEKERREARGVVAAQPQPAEKGRREAAGSVAAQPLPAEKGRREAAGGCCGTAATCGEGAAGSARGLLRRSRYLRRRGRREARGLFPCGGGLTPQWRRPARRTRWVRVRSACGRWWRSVPGWRILRCRPPG